MKADRERLKEVYTDKSNIYIIIVYKIMSFHILNTAEMSLNLHIKS